MADLTYALHYIPSPKPTKETVNGLILRTLTHKNKKNEKKTTTTITFWELESRWLRGDWLRRPMKLRFKLTVGEAQKQPNLHLQNLTKAQKLAGKKVPLKAAIQLKLLEDSIC